MQVQSMQVTPEIAQSWLDRPSPRQRIITESQVLALAELMASGEWDGHPAPYIFDTEGHLIDGQHRASAIVLAGVTIDSASVITGVDPEMFDKIDVGRRRTVAQFIHLPNSVLIASAARLVMTHRVDPGLSDPKRRNESWSFTEVLSEVAENSYLQALAPSVAQAQRRSHVHGPSLLAISTIGAQKHPDLVDDWLYGIATGESLSPGDPRLKLREKWIREYRLLNMSSADRTRWAFIVKAWNSWVREENVGTFRFRLPAKNSPGEPMPDIL